MTKMREIFDPAKPIDRRIEKVITYDSADVDLLRQEILEYVVTDSIEQNISRLLDLLDEGMGGGDNREVGVWVSGFYGSGKSSFTKYLGFALDHDRKIDDSPFLKWLQNQCPSQALRARLSTVAQKHAVTVIMLDLASAALTGASKERISTTLYYSVMQWAGYSRDKKIAYLEFMLERDGKMPEFEKRVTEVIPDVTWQDIKNQPLVVKTIASKLSAEFYPHIWPDSKAFNEIRLEEAEKEDDRVREMLELVRKKSGKENVIFILDEVGQYIAQSDDLILNVDGLAKNFKNIGRGHAWIIATAQQTLTEDDPTAALNTAKLFKLKDRFPVAVDLEAHDIREICYRRLLSKSKEGEELLYDSFTKYGPQLRNATQLKETRLYKSELTKETFARFYPLLPHHFDILFELLSKLAKTSGGIGLRSAIKIIQDVLIDQSKLRPGARLLADEPVGTLATTVVFYDTLRRDILRSFSHVVDGVDKTQNIFGPDSLPTQVAKSIAVLQLLEGFPVSAENLAALLHPTVDAASLLEPVKTAVAELLAEPAIPVSEVDGSLRFMSAAVADLEKERNNINPRLADTRNILNIALRTLFTPVPTARLGGTKSLSTGFKVSSGAMAISLLGDKEEIQTHLDFVPETQYSTRRQERLLESQQTANRNAIFLLGREQPEVDNLLVEICRSRIIYEQHRHKATDKEVEEYLRAQDQRAAGLTEELERVLKKALTGGSFIFRGQLTPVTQISEDLVEAVKGYLQEAAQQVFEKYPEAPIAADSNLAERFLKTEPLNKIASQDDPLGLVNKGGGQLINISHKAIISIKDYLEQRGQVEGRKLLDDFYAAPYGWSKDITRYLIAAMLMGGLVKLRVSGEDITVRGEGAVNSLKNTNNFNKIGIALREAGPDPDKLFRARDRLIELTGEDILPLEEDISKAVMKHFPDFQQLYAPLSVELRNLELPGVDRVESIRDNIAELLKGDASDAASRLGGKDCPFFDALVWVRSIQKAFENGIGKTIQKANELLREIPLLPEAGIPGSLITETAETRERLQEYLGREDFFNHIPEIQNLMHALETHTQKKAADFREGQSHAFQKTKDKLQGSSSWQQIGSEDQARLATDLEEVRYSEAKDLSGFKKLIGEKFKVDTDLLRVEEEVKAIVRQQRQSRRVLEQDLTALPRVITAPAQLEEIITELESLKKIIEDYEEIILNWS